MNIIVGATGQIGSYLISNLKKKNVPLRAVVRNPEKLKDASIEFRKADLFDKDELTKAFEGGTSVFVLTPESQSSDDIIGDTERIVSNYRHAIEQTGIERVVGLSCVGAHINARTGNIRMSGILEQGLNDLEVRKTFIRPSYYFSNWLGYMETMKQYGVLPTFFPENLSIEMNSPLDVAEFIANVMVEEVTDSRDFFELCGPRPYTSGEVARIFSNVLGSPVIPQVIPPDKWQETLLSVGFSENTAMNLADMTRAVVETIAVPERPADMVRLPTTLDDYLISGSA
jgi:uncharacterized protein YbjT (DUF2867 family)